MAVYPISDHNYTEHGKHDLYTPSRKYKQQRDDFILPHTVWSNGDIRLVSEKGDDEGKGVTSTDFSSGRLEVYMKTLLVGDSIVGSGGGVMGSWGSVCGTGFSLVEAHVACKQLGYARALKWERSSETR